MPSNLLSGFKKFYNNKMGGTSSNKNPPHGGGHVWITLGSRLLLIMFFSDINHSHIIYIEHIKYIKIKI
jgi:hypothetical protein